MGILQLLSLTIKRWFCVHPPPSHDHDERSTLFLLMKLYWALKSNIMSTSISGLQNNDDSLVVQEVLPQGGGGSNLIVAIGVI